MSNSSAPHAVAVVSGSLTAVGATSFSPIALPPKDDRPVYVSPPSRTGKVAVNVWVTPERRRAMKLLALQQQTTLDDLMNRAIDDILRAA